MVAFFFACCGQDGDYLSPFNFSFCTNEEHGVKWFTQLNNNFYVKKELTNQGDEM